MTDHCLFCKMITGDMPCQKAAETDKILAFHDINPQAPQHILFIHKQHSPTLLETEEADQLGELMGAVRDLAKERQLKNFRVVINNGAEAGQSVFHLHVHLLAGRPFTWPPG